MRRAAAFVTAIVVFGLLAVSSGTASTAARSAAPSSAKTPAASPVTTGATASQTITVDGQSSGQTFDGLGGLSAGASSALLEDYPAKQRQQILDYLFKPDYGASLQILKVEIGGDTNSTDGSEESDERVQGHIDCNRGYEWTLMEQAKALNPHIKLYGLQWGAPAWVGNGAQTIFTDQDITYLLDWLGCAKQHHLQINYLGGWNEHGFNAAWYVELRQALDANGYSGIQIVAADEDTAWTVAPALESDPAFDAAVSIDGQHDPCSIRDATEVGVCPSTAAAQSLGKPLWNSEQGVNVYNANVPQLAQEINRDYIDGKITGMVSWSLIWSAYSSLPLQGTGLMLANTPWSGNYTAANTMIWAMAHTTQFAQPGWQYLDTGSQVLSNGGSVATLRSPSSDNWSSIVEAGEATAPETVAYQVQGGLSTQTVHVWATNMSSTDPGQWFRHVANVRPQNGSFKLTVQPGFIYSLTTTTGQHKGTAQPPPAQGWKLPYGDNFNEYRPGVDPKYFSTLGGAFDTARCIGRSGMCLQQQLTEQPVRWNNLDNYPVAVVGDPSSWSNYQVSADALLQQPGYVELDGRSPATQGRGAGSFNSSPGYHFRIDDQGNWSVYKQDTTGATTTLASGTAAHGFGVDQWHRLGLSLRGDEITASLDGKALATVLDPTYQLGQVSLEVSPWVNAQFDNFAVEPLPVQGQGPELGSVTPSAVDYASTASSASVSTTVTNPGKLKATAIDAQLQLPAGWTATPTRPAPASLAAGASAPLAWQFTAPASAFPGQYQATIQVTYREGGLTWITSTTVPILYGVIPQSQMTATATSTQAGNLDCPTALTDCFVPANALDGNPATFWHTEFNPAKAVPPQSITIDLGGTYDVSGLTYLPRQDLDTGRITQYNVYASTDGTNFTLVASGTWADDTTLKTASFLAVDARYIRLEGVAASNNNVAAAEINVLGTPSNGAIPTIPQSQMTATATSTQAGNLDCPTALTDCFVPANALDGNPATFWHTEFNPAKAVPPQSITIDLGGTYDVSGLTYLPRQDASQGRITEFNVYASTDGTNFTLVATGNWGSDTNLKSAGFNAPGARFIRLEGVQAVNNNVSAAEINILGTPSG